MVEPGSEEVLSEYRCREGVQRIGEQWQQEGGSDAGNGTRVCSSPGAPPSARLQVTRPLSETTTSRVGAPVLVHAAASVLS